MFKKILLLFLFAVILPATQAHADKGSALPDLSDPQGTAPQPQPEDTAPSGPAYTTKEAKQAASKMKKRRMPVALDDKENDAENTDGTAEEKPKTVEEEIMEKYMELAAGTTAEEDASAKEEPDSEKESADASAEDGGPRPGSVESILEGYKKRLNGGSNMHSRSMPLPEDREK